MEFLNIQNKTEEQVEREVKAFIKWNQEKIKEHAEHLQQVSAQFDQMFTRLFEQKAKREAVKR